MAAADFVMTEGIPYRRRIVLTDGKNAWPNLTDFEIRCQVRVTRSSTSALKFDLTPFITKAFEGNDIVATLSLTGAEVRTVKTGYYSVVVSDPGVVDAKAIPLVQAEVKMKPNPTAAS